MQGAGQGPASWSLPAPIPSSTASQRWRWARVQESLCFRALCSGLGPSIAGVHMAKGPVQADRQEVGLERRAVQGLW